MSAYTPIQEEEITPEGHAQRLSVLRRRNIAISKLPITHETLVEYYALKADYSAAGYEANAAAIGRRIEAYT